MTYLTISIIIASYLIFDFVKIFKHSHFYEYVITFVLLVFIWPLKLINLLKQKYE